MKVCLTVCKHYQKYFVFEDKNKASSVSILNVILEYLIHENSYSKLLKWKYLAELVQCSVGLVEKIIVSCTLEEVNVFLIYSVTGITSLAYKFVCLKED